MAAVVALLSVLVGLLSGLTGGLAHQNVSAVAGLPGDRVVMAPTTKGSAADWSDSAVTAAQEARWSSAPGVTAVDPVGASQLRATTGSASAAVALIGSDAALDGAVVPAAGQVVVSGPAADDLGVARGSALTIAGRRFVVAGISGDEWYSHTPVIHARLDDWRSVAASSGSAGSYATALLVTGKTDWAGLDAAAGTSSTSVLGSVALLPAFRSEIGSLLLIVALLFGISALVVGAFFTVWTIQRRGDIAILKALGADNSTLRRDALGQAAVVLVVGIAVGMGVTVAGGIAARRALPFSLSPLTTVLPAALMAALGLAGAALAVRSISSAQPLTALGSNR